ALVAGVLVYVLLDRGVAARWRMAMLATTAVCATAMLAFAWQQDLSTTAPWLRGRLFLWRVALHLVGEHPLAGVGLGGYLPAYGGAAATLIAGDANAFVPLSSVDFAHNDLLQFAAEGGLVTALAFVLVVVSAVAYAYQRNDPLSRASSAALAAIFVNGFADSPMRVPSTFVLFFFLLGSLSPSVLRALGRWPLLVAVALTGLLQGVRFTAGNAYWTRGRDALRTGRPAAVDLERARFFLPEHGIAASQLARALARAGKFEAAVTAAQVAATLRFDFDDEITRLDLRARSLERTAAIREWQELSARFPMLVTPYMRLGALHLQANDRAAAITAYETVLASSQPTKRAEDARTQARDMLRSLLSSDPERR
ncbi:MAG: O-antigen ligase family protein, partial [Myxococcota bacterium]